MSIFDRLNGQPQMNMQQLRSDPLGAARKAGYNVPPELANDPRAMVMHLMQTGQIQSPMMQKIMPIMQRLGLK